MLEFKLLLLIGIANGTPVIVKKLLGPFWAFPVDTNKILFDGQPVFGPSKTIRGLVSSVLATSLGAALLSFYWLHGFYIAVSAMVGDLLSSFVKRRMGKASSSMALGIDQIPESLLPMIVSKYLLDLPWLSVALVVVIFFITELLLSILLYKLKIRDVPY
ncbi:CDP-archaeol synthase [Kaarinaea lacus]